MNRCSYCLNSRAIISENGIHYNCCLNSAKSIKCILGERSSYIEKPGIDKGELKDENSFKNK